MSTMPMWPPPVFIPWRAALIAPLAAPAAYVIIVTLEALVSRPGSVNLTSLAQLAELSLVAGAPVAYVGAAFGLSLYVSLARLRLTSAPVIIGGGAAIGAIVAIFLAPYLRGELFSLPLGAWRGALCGAAAGALWWRQEQRATSRPRT